MSKSSSGKPKPPSRLSGAGAMFGIKKLAYQFSKAVGYVDPTTLPQQVQHRCQECEGYRAALIEACEAMLQIMQGNPTYTPEVNSTQQCEYPPGTAPSEQFVKSLDNMKGFWYDEELLALCVKQCALIAVKQREFQDRGRRQIHLIRTFINSVYFEFEDLKRSLLKAKEDMEMAQEDLKKGETAFRKRSARKTMDKYEAELKAMEQFLNVKLPAQKVEHVKEIEAMVSEIQSYHEWMASYCTPLANYKVARPPNL
ncbi:hypothetical protein Q1695_013055 [Nippostrongylus brasiliensis]|nr:hypothetical protein Q1695_013055 [Nippostrongylus brasiliensis]